MTARKLLGVFTAKLMILISDVATAKVDENVERLEPDTSIERSSDRFSAKAAHEILARSHPELLAGPDELISLYYFGSSSLKGKRLVPADKNGLTVARVTPLEQSYRVLSAVGVERVGEDYLPDRGLLFFENDQLVGYYYPVNEFPSSFRHGLLTFPVGSGIKDVELSNELPLELVQGSRSTPLFRILH